MNEHSADELYRRLAAGLEDSDRTAMRGLLMVVDRAEGGAGDIDAAEALGLVHFVDQYELTILGRKVFAIWEKTRQIGNSQR